MNWQLQESKNRLSELVRAAKTKGPQVITVHGKEEVAMVAIEEFRRLKRNGKPSGKGWWEAAPKIALTIERSRDVGRAVDLG